MRLVLIGGAQRSGTTLLQTLIANALDTPVLPEAHILYDILAAYRRAKEFGNKTRFFYPTDIDLLSFFQLSANRHIADIVKNTNPGSALVLKDPNLVQVKDEAADLFPDAIRIVCLRDPRDIAASFLRIGQRQQKDEAPSKYQKRNLYFIAKKILPRLSDPRDIATSYFRIGLGQQRDGKPSKYQRRDVNFIASKISASYSPLMTGGQPLNVILVRYEDLVTEPRQTLTTLARSTGLDFQLARIDDPKWLDAGGRHEASWVSELEGHKPMPDSIGAFNKVMRPKEIAIVEKICEPFMVWSGYKKST